MKALYFTTHEGGTWMKIPKRFQKLPKDFEDFTATNVIGIYAPILDKEIISWQSFLEIEGTLDYLHFAAIITQEGNLYRVYEKTGVTLCDTLSEIEMKKIKSLVK